MSARFCWVLSLLKSWYFKALSSNLIPRVLLFTVFSLRWKKENDRFDSGPYKPALPCTRVVSYFLLLHLGVIPVSMKNAHDSAHITVAMGGGRKGEPQQNVTTKRHQRGMTQTQERALSFTVYWKQFIAAPRDFKGVSERIRCDDTIPWDTSGATSNS